MAGVSFEQSYAVNDQIWRRHLQTLRAESEAGITPTQDAREMNLLASFSSVLVEGNVPQEIVSQWEEVAWDTHMLQLAKRDGIDMGKRYEPSPEQIAEEKRRKEEWDAMTPEQQEQWKKDMWARVESNPDFIEGMRRGLDDMRNGRYYSMDMIEQDHRIPKVADRHSRRHIS
jgi:hypothetical protein